MSAVVIIPSTLLYWGHVPAGALAGTGVAFRFERFLPVPVDGLLIAESRLPDRSTLVVGIDRAALRAHLAGRPDITPQTWEMVPDGLPPALVGLPGATEALVRLNLLQGDFEPVPCRRLRRLTMGLAQLALLLVASGVVVGIERRHAAGVAYAEAQRLAGAAALASVVPAGPGSSPALRLTMEVRRLELAARDANAHAADVAQELQGLWQVWPRDLRIQVDTVGANGDRVVIRGRAATLADSERLAAACARLVVPGSRFRAEPLQAQQDERGATFLLTLARVAEAGAP